LEVSICLFSSCNYNKNKGYLLKISEKFIPAGKELHNKGERYKLIFCRQRPILTSSDAVFTRRLGLRESHPLFPSPLPSPSQSSPAGQSTPAILRTYENKFSNPLNRSRANAL
ncbi:MAG: hypothetical protein OEW04_04060, partial [Nitrospirota bacterium]|nr:hypothetical protein [Nitrospirota bacterium]